MTRVVLVAASPLERAGLEAILVSSGLEVSGTFASARLLVERLADLQPDAVLVALDAQEDEPPAEVYQLASAPDAPPVAVLAAQASTAWAADTLRAGVRAVLARLRPPPREPGRASGPEAAHPA